jgi:hypothetical protein
MFLSGTGSVTATVDVDDFGCYERARIRCKEFNRFGNFVDLARAAQWMRVA